MGVSTHGAAQIGPPLHVGIVGCSAEGAALCYRTICAEGARWLGAHAHPEVSMHTPSLSAYVQALQRSDLAAVGELMLASAHKLAAIGADVLICPDNTLHQALPLILSRLPRPWLHIADVVAQQAAARGFRRVALTGTRWLVDSDVYPASLSAFGIDCVRPTADERSEIDRRIMDELVPGRATAQTADALLRIIERMKQEEGCDAVVLGCTELPLVIDDRNSPLPTLDSTRLLARAALRFAMGSETKEAPCR